MNVHINVCRISLVLNSEARISIPISCGLMPSLCEFSQRMETLQVFDIMRVVPCM